MADTPHTGSGRAFPILAEHGLDLVFLAVGQLETATGEEFNAIVGHGIMGGGDHRSHLDVEHGGQEGHARSGDDAGIDHVESAGAHARGQCGSEKIAGHSRIPADQCTATTFRLPLLGFAIPQHAYGGIAQIQRQLRGQVPIRQSSNAIGSKHVRHEYSVLAI